MKAVGGVFIIDDFGRQLVQPRDLLNRWIIPLEKRVDYLTIHTGKKFDVPFDELVIFSTNLSPQSLMDPGIMRRVKYKLRLDPPSMTDYVTIFRQGLQRTQHRVAGRSAFLSAWGLLPAIRGDVCGLPSCVYRRACTCRLPVYGDRTPVELKIWLKML